MLCVGVDAMDDSICDSMYASCNGIRDRSASNEASTDSTMLDYNPNAIWTAKQRKWVWL